MTNQASQEFTQQQQETLFSAWLEQALTPLQQSQFEDLCVNNSDFSKRVAQANNMHLLSEAAGDVDVPNWDKNALFATPTKTSWWQWQGMPLTALCTSLAAVFLLITNFTIELNNGRISFGFGQNMSTQQVQALVEERVQEYQKSNRELLAQYVDIMQNQQLQNSAQLTEYLLSSSRKERREDFAELIKFVNQQRSDDQVFYARQIHDLQNEINLQADYRLQPTIPSSSMLIND